MYAYSNNGLTKIWHDESEEYEPTVGELLFDDELSEEELADHFPGYTAAKENYSYKTEAISALVRSDAQVIRCSEKGEALPEEWIEYRQALRDIYSGEESGPLPERPPYPTV